MRETVQGMAEEDLFLTHDLVLRLRMRPEARLPRASSLSAYYEALRSVLRALARPRGTRGRASHDLEEALDFAMPDVQVTPPNGKPAEVVLPLDGGGAPGGDAAAAVRRGGGSVRGAAVPGAGEPSGGGGRAHRGVRVRR